VKICFHVQTHNAPDQVLRLVTVLTEQSPGCVVLLSHKRDGVPLDVGALEALGDVHVLPASGGLGDFSHVDRYLETVDWLTDHDVDFDWLTNITGSDYPVRPLPDVEQELATGGVDGFLQYERLLEHGGNDEGICTPGHARDRYLYRYWRLGFPTERRRRLLRPAMAANLVQPWLRVSSTHLGVGVRRRTPFTDDFVLYGGGFYCTLSRECVLYVRQHVRENPGLVRYLRATLDPEEVFFQTILVNSGRFRLRNDSKRFQDYGGGRHGHTQVFGVRDFDRIVASGAHFARRVDLAREGELLDLLDARVLRRVRR
jgi:hypothetical protein